MIFLKLVSRYRLGIKMMNVNPNGYKKCSPALHGHKFSSSKLKNDLPIVWEKNLHYHKDDFDFCNPDKKRPICKKNNKKAIGEMKTETFPQKS